MGRNAEPARRFGALAPPAPSRGSIRRSGGACSLPFGSSALILNAASRCNSPSRDLRSWQTGDYRIVYRVIESRIEILVVAVGHRRDVYARLKKMLDAR